MEQVLHVFPNGLRAVVCPMPHVQSVSMGIWASVGGRHEPARVSGISHFIEHLLFKGTRTRSAAAISRAIEGRGGDFNAFTQEDATCYYARVAAPQAEAAFAILADLFHHPRFAPADVRSEREVIRDEIFMYRDQPAQVAEDLLGELLWSGHPLGRPLTGTPESLDRITRGDLLRFKAAGYGPGCTVVAIAGRVEPDRWFRRIAREWAGVPAGAPPPHEPVTDAVPQQGAAVACRPVEQSHLALGFRVFGREDERRYALKALSVMLGENMSSRLFQVVREKYGLAYAIQSCVSHFADTGSLVVTAGVEPDETARVLRLTLGEIRRMRDRPAGARELRRAKDYIGGQIRLGLESSGRCMNWAGESVSAHGRVVAPGEVLAKVEQVTSDAVQAVACEVFRPARASLALAGPGLQEADSARWAARIEAGLLARPVARQAGGRRRTTIEQAACPVRESSNS